MKEKKQVIKVQSLLTRSCVLIKQIERRPAIMNAQACDFSLTSEQLIGVDCACSPTGLIVAIVSLLATIASVKSVTTLAEPR